MNYHLIGIGGISMSGIARYLKAHGEKVSGCDFIASRTVEKLKSEGVPVELGHSENHINQNLDRVIYNIRVVTGPGRCEIEKAQKLGIEVIDRLKLIGELAKSKISIAIAGMHGKTTTTAMIGSILMADGLDPNILLGGNYNGFGGNMRMGQGKYFLYEACEYDSAFIELMPNYAIITNVEKEHMDRFRDLEEILDTFRKFISRIDSDGKLIVWGDDANIKKVIQMAKCQVIRYGFEKDNDYVIDNFEEKSDRKTFQVKTKDKILEITLKVPGKHNILDATSAAVLSLEIGVKEDKIKQALAKFSGVDRRIEIKDQIKDVIIIDDYAHNPTEILTTLTAIAQFYPDRKLTVVFRPSQYSRNEAFRKEYGTCFVPAQEIILLETLVPPGKEAELKKVTSQDLVEEIQKNDQKAKYLTGFTEVIDYFQKNPPKGIVVTMGLGNMYELAEELIRTLR